MVLGLSKNRWHVPVQILGTVFFVVGYFLAHAHAGRNYVRRKTPHAIYTDTNTHTLNMYKYITFVLLFSPYLGTSYRTPLVCIDCYMVSGGTTYSWWIP